MRRSTDGEGSLYVRNCEAGFCQQQSVDIWVFPRYSYGGRADNGTTKSLNQGILAISWFPRTDRNRYRVRVPGLADEAGYSARDGLMAEVAGLVSVIWV